MELTTHQRDLLLKQQLLLDLKEISAFATPLIKGYTFSDAKRHIKASINRLTAYREEALRGKNTHILIDGKPAPQKGSSRHEIRTLLDLSCNKDEENLSQETPEELILSPFTMQTNVEELNDALKGAPSQARIRQLIVQYFQNFILTNQLTEDEKELKAYLALYHEALSLTDLEIFRMIMSHLIINHSGRKMSYEEAYGSIYRLVNPEGHILCMNAELLFTDIVHQYAIIHQLDKKKLNRFRLQHIHNPLALFTLDGETNKETFLDITLMGMRLICAGFDLNKLPVDLETVTALPLTIISNDVVKSARDLFAELPK